MSAGMIPITKPWTGDAEVEAGRRPIRSGWLTQGPEVAAFEREFADAVGAPHACAVSNCTTALHLALRAAGVGEGDEVVTVSHSFIATANAIRYCGAVPVFVDIEAGGVNIDPALVERALTPRTRAILCVHQLGMPCDILDIAGLGRRLGIPVIEDAACALGSEIFTGSAWERIGRPHGDAACFSFHPRKVITTGDGGMVTTHRPDWDAKFRLWRQHSMSVPDTVRHGAAQVIRESYVELGYNYRMTDVQAAVGREQLKRLDTIVRRRRELAERYRTLLAALPVTILPEPSWARTNWQSFAVTLPDGVDQRAIMQAMLDAGVATRRGVMCSHLEPAFQHEPWSCGPDRACGCGGGRCARLARSERATDRTVLLPLFPQMTDAEQQRVVDALQQAWAGSALIHGTP
jgi:dTDP-4-amino-4,6-dideoxygalactose transaminase